MTGRFRTGLLALMVVWATGAMSETRTRVLEFSDLDGWENDDHAKALDVFLDTCTDLTAPDWAALCAVAQSQASGREFFELFFRPVLVEDGRAPLFTGYFEPQLEGALERSDRFRYPVYAMPPEAERAERWLSRREIMESNKLAEQDLEIAWVDDPVELFFLQIQGSGRIRLRDGSYIRLGYAGSNGHPYRSIGQELIRRGIYDRHQVSAQVIRNWVERNPEKGRELLYHNPSFVFFRRVDEVPSDKGPLGAMNRSITAGRSIAVDPDFTPLGAPVWIEKNGAHPLRRLMVAQDTGSAIKGAQRADIYYGSGDAAGRLAGKMKDGGRMVVLMPIQRAYANLRGGIQ
jgi:membrane-bound lytic murein transglycosylase A